MHTKIHEWMTKIICIQGLYVLFFVEGNPLFIKAPSGQVQGMKVKTPNGKTANAFFGIPYAEPPIGPNRFLPPKVKQPWNGVLLADNFSDSCFQYTNQLFENAFGWSKSRSNMSEDCLYLNIWVPNPIKPEKPTAVLVWIHGGAFLMGSSNVKLYDGGTLASEGNVVVVTINYRLNVLGFLNLENATADGKIGFYDQLAALKWIQVNIVSFGGDPRRVTIFGESAGGVSAVLHLASAETKNLFNNAIIESGPATLVPKILGSNQKFASKIVSDYVSSLNCSRETPNETLNCLRQIKPEVLISYIPQLTSLFFTLNTEENIMKESQFQKVDVLLGVVEDDGSTFALVINPDTLPFKEECFPTRADKQQMVARLFASEKDIVKSAIDFFYTDWIRPNDTSAIRQEMIDMASDYLIKCDTSDLSDHLVTTGGTVYLYQFSHRPSNSKFPKWMGSVHGDELPFVFGRPLDDNKGFNKDEVELSKKMMRYWANFAKYGNPNGKTKGTFEEWPPYTLNDKQYLDISTNISNKTGIRDRECAFWFQFLPELKRFAESTTR